MLIMLESNYCNLWLMRLGPNFIPEIFNPAIVDEILQVKTEEAFEASRLLAKKEGLLAGMSSGAAVSAAYRVASRPQNKGKTVVVLLPDSGERYLSTGLCTIMETLWQY